MELKKSSFDWKEEQVSFRDCQSFLLKENLENENDL